MGTAFRSLIDYYVDESGLDKDPLAESKLSIDRTIMTDSTVPKSLPDLEHILKHDTKVKVAGWSHWI